MGAACSDSCAGFVCAEPRNRGRRTEDGGAAPGKGSVASQAPQPAENRRAGTADEGSQEGAPQSQWRITCCRRREPARPQRRAQPRVDASLPWVPREDPLEAEWAVCERGTSEQEYELLIKFRELVKSTGLDSHLACSKVPHTKRATTLLRFLRARQGNMQKALDLMGRALDWRRDFGIDRRLSEWRSELAAGTARSRVVLKYWHIDVIGPDRFGLPIFLNRCAVLDAAGLVGEVGTDVLIVHSCLYLEEALEAARLRMLKTGVLINSFVEIHDLGNYGLVPRWLQRAMGSIPMFKKVAPVMDEVYPERVRAAFLLRAPSAFSMVFKLVQPIVPEETKKKIKIYGYPAHAWREELSAAVGESAVPPFLLCDDMAVVKEATPAGGIVPAGALAEEEALVAR